MVLRKQATQGVETFNINHLTMPQDAVRDKITTAIQDYKQIKKQSNQCNIWVVQTIMAQADAKNMEKAKLQKTLRQKEQSCVTARKVKKA